MKANTRDYGKPAAEDDFKPYVAPNGVMVNNRQDAEDRYWGRGKYADITPENSRS